MADEKAKTPEDAIRIFFTAENAGDLAKGLTVTRGSAARSVATAFAHAAVRKLKFSPKIKVKKSTTKDRFRFLTTSVRITFDGETQDVDFLFALTELDGSWVITYMEDETEMPEPEDYQELSTVKLTDSKARYDKIYKRLTE